MSEEPPDRRGPEDPEPPREDEDETVEESFPSSDPPSTGGPGI